MFYWMTLGFSEVYFINRLVFNKVVSQLERVVRQETGSSGSLDFRVRFYYKQKSGALKPISPWHDVPLYHTNSGVNIYNFICEVSYVSISIFSTNFGFRYISTVNLSDTFLLNHVFIWFFYFVLLDSKMDPREIRNRKYVLNLK